MFSPKSSYGKLQKNCIIVSIAMYSTGLFTYKHKNSQESLLILKNSSNYDKDSCAVLKSLLF